MAVAKNQTAAKPTTRTAKKAPASSAARSAQQNPENADAAAAKRVTVTIPLDAAVVDVALKAVTLPVTTAKKVAQNKNGIPAYVAVGGLAVVGAVEWPVAAVTGLGLAALRRWGPLKPAREPEPTPAKEAEPAKEA